MKKHLYAIALLSVLNLQAEDITKLETSNSNGLLGQSSIGAYVGTARYADEETSDLLDNNFIFGLGVSLKTTENISLGLSMSTMRADIDYNGITGDASGLALSASALYHFFPKEDIDPYISLGLRWVSTKVDMEYQGTTYSEDNSDNGYMFSAGAEFDLSETVFLTPSASYTKVGDGDASKDIAVAIDFKITETIYLGGIIEIELDETNTGYFVGISGKF